jgi:hypothetical protein
MSNIRKAIGVLIIIAVGFFLFSEVTLAQKQGLEVYAIRTSKAIESGGTLYAVYSPACNSGYVATGGGCSLQFAGVRNGLEANRPYPSDGIPTKWECRGRNNFSRTIHVTAHVVCARWIP